MTYTSTREDGPERRLAIRKHVLWEGRLGVDDRELDCVILNVSLSGARIDLQQDAPAHGRLALTSERFGTLHAAVMWEDGRSCGLRFLESRTRVAETVGRHVPLT